MIYNLTDTEFEFLRMFCEIPRLPGFKDISEISKVSDPQITVANLESKGYMEKDEGGKYFLEEELTFLLMAAQKASASVSIAGLDKELSAYFTGETIVLIKKDQMYEILWIPYLPFLIGAIADFMEPYLNKETTDEKVHTPDALSEIQSNVIGTGCKKLWEISFYESRERKSDNFIEIYGDQIRQIKIQRNEDNLFVSSPCKKDFVNSITSILAHSHANAIKRGVTL